MSVTFFELRVFLIRGKEGRQGLIPGGDGGDGEAFNKGFKGQSRLALCVLAGGERILAALL